MGRMIVLNRSGDIQIVWDSDDAKSTERARSEFKRMISSGYIAYQILKDGRPGGIVRDFDPGLDRVVLIPVPAAG